MPQGYDPIAGSVSGLFPSGGAGAPKPPMGRQLPMAQPPMPPGMGQGMAPDPQRMALLQALAQKIGGMGRGGA